MQYDNSKNELTLGSVKITRKIDLRFKLAFFCGLGLGLEISDRHFFNTTAIIVTLAIFRFSIEIY